MTERFGGVCDRAIFQAVSRTGNENGIPIIVESANLLEGGNEIDLVLSHARCNEELVDFKICFSTSPIEWSCEEAQVVDSKGMDANGKVRLQLRLIRSTFKELHFVRVAPPEGSKEFRISAPFYMSKGADGR